MSHLCVLGASGRTGRLVIDYALSKGHTLTGLVRDPDALTRRDGLELTTGTPVHPVDVAQAMDGADAVVVALNSSRTSDRPWAKPVSPPRLMADSVANATAAMRERGIRRIIVVSAFGAGDSLSRQPVPTRWMIQHTNLSYTYADHNLVDAEIRTTDTDWTLLRAVALNDKGATGKVAVTDLDGPRPSLFISRADVARFAVDAIDDGRYIREAPIISNLDSEFLWQSQSGESTPGMPSGGIGYRLARPGD
jgi:putative NADH-flavin reductase